MGIEPTSLAWEAGILPMNYTRIDFYILTFLCEECKMQNMMAERRTDSCCSGCAAGDVDQ